MSVRVYEYRAPSTGEKFLYSVVGGNDDDPPPTKQECIDAIVQWTAMRMSDCPDLDPLKSPENHHIIREYLKEWTERLSKFTD